MILISENIVKQKRREQKLTQKQLSEQSGINLRTLQDYEQGHRKIENANFQTVLSLADVLKCDAKEFISFR